MFHCSSFFGFSVSGGGGGGGELNMTLPLVLNVTKNTLVLYGLRVLRKNGAHEVIDAVTVT